MSTETALDPYRPMPLAPPQKPGTLALVAKGLWAARGFLAFLGIGTSLLSFVVWLGLNHLEMLVDVGFFALTSLFAIGILTHVVSGAWKILDEFRAIGEEEWKRENGLLEAAEEETLPCP